MTPSRLKIAVDGTAASGKGTLCRRLGQTLDLAVLDTGKLYRLIGIKTLDAGLSHDDEARISALAAKTMQSFQLSDLDDPRLSSDEAGEMGSVTGQYPDVRKHLFDFQRSFPENTPPKDNGDDYKGAILDGRDIGTVILPDADAKLYITAKTEVRAERRMKELQSRGISVTYNAVLKGMLERDKRDAGRKDAPMKPADDAHIIDTSDLSIDEAFNLALSLIRETMAR